MVYSPASELCCFTNTQINLAKVKFFKCNKCNSIDLLLRARIIIFVKSDLGKIQRTISKISITLKGKARTDEKDEHTLSVCDHFEEVRNAVIG